MKLDMYQYLQTDKFVEHAILHVMGNNKGEFTDLPKDEEGKVLPIDVVMTINGIEVNIIHFLDLLEKVYMESVVNTATNVVNEKIDSQLNEIYSNLDTLKVQTEQLTKELLGKINLE
jgi:hypothetical protein